MLLLRCCESLSLNIYEKHHTEITLFHKECVNYLVFIHMVESAVNGAITFSH